MTQHTNPMGFESINKLIMRFSIPAITGMMINALYNIVDRIYIGNHPELGANGLAGITLGFPMMLIMLAMAVLFGVGGATLFSMSLGQKNPDQAKRTLSTSFILLTAISIIYMIVGQVFLPQLLVLFGASETILPYSMEYMRVILFGTTFQVLSMGLNHFVRADGSPKIAMYTMFLGAGTNILLDPLFIFVFGWGMFGAAFATVIAQALSATWVVLYFIGKKSHIHLDLKTLVFDSALAKKLSGLGMPGFSLQLAGSLLVSILNRSLTVYGGDLAVSAMGIVNSVQTFMIMPIIGLNQGLQPIISFNFGAKQYARVKEAIKLGITYASLITLSGYLLTLFFPSFLVSIFNREPELMALSEFALSTWFSVLFVIGFQIIASNFFQAIGRSKMALFLTLTRQVLILIPAILILPLFFGLDGVFYAGPTADFLAFLITGFFFLKTYNSLDHLKATETLASVSEESLEII